MPTAALVPSIPVQSAAAWTRPSVRDLSPTDQAKEVPVERHPPPNPPDRLDRREFFRWTGRGALGLGALGTVPWLLAACGRDEPAVTAPVGAGEAGPIHGRVIVGDVLDHALRSDEWE